MALSTDPNTILLEYLLDESPVGEVHGSVSVRAPNGYMYGEGAPDDAYLEFYRFSGLSSKEPLLPSDSEQSLRAVLARYYAGGEARVWRNYPVNLTAFHFVNNPEGYSDLTPVEGSEEKSFPWGDVTMDRFDFVLEGLEVR